MTSEFVQKYVVPGHVMAIFRYHHPPEYNAQSSPLIDWHYLENQVRETTVIMMANQRKGKHLKESMRTQSGKQEQMTEWKNASDQVAIGFDFMSDLLWTNQRSQQSKTNAIQDYSDTELRIA